MPKFTKAQLQEIAKSMDIPIKTEKKDKTIVELKDDILCKFLENTVFHCKPKVEEPKVEKKPKIPAEFDMTEEEKRDFIDYDDEEEPEEDENIDEDLLNELPDILRENDDLPLIVTLEDENRIREYFKNQRDMLDMFGYYYDSRNGRLRNNCIIRTAKKFNLLPQSYAPLLDKNFYNKIKTGYY